MTQEPEEKPERESEPQSDFSSDVLRRLAEHAGGFGRYKIRGEVARGGQGAVLRVWDEDLKRNLAMKVILGSGEESSGQTPHVDPKTLGRFLEEAQVTGQLDHPGIVPVHELGLDSEGRVYFTMKLVKGMTLREVFDKVQRNEDGWTVTRALGVLLKVCEAMSYAHAKHVIHRDLKPANVMVGRFGEVHVMDWGLARVIGREDPKDIRIQEPSTSQSVVRSERREMAGDTPDSPLVTMDGDVVGTPAYMSPEQAKGQLDLVGPPSDVYSVGAMLYHLLTGQMPYVPPDGKVNNYAVWQRVQEGPCQSVRTLVSDVPQELEAICEKGMARDVADRYSDTAALGEDLRAYLERRVVKAYESGPLAEAKKWAQRNRGFASVLAAAALLLVAGLAITTHLGRQTRAYAAQVDDLNARRESLRYMRLATKLADRYMNPDEALTCLDRVDQRHRGWLWSLLQDHVRRRTYGTNLSLQDGLVVYDIEFSPDGTQLASGGGGESIGVWSLKDRGKIASLPTRDQIFSVSYSQDGRRIAAAGSGGQLVVWNTATDVSVWCDISEERSFIFTGFLAPEQEAVIAVSRDGHVVRWDLERSKSGEVVFVHKRDSVLSAALSAEKDLLALGTKSGAVRLIDLRTNTEKSAIDALDGNVLQLAFAEGGGTIVSGGNRIVRIHEDLTDPRVVDTFPANAVGMAVVPDRATGETVVFAGGEKGLLRVYGARSGALFLTDTLAENWVTTLAASSDGRLLAAVAGNTQLLLIPLRAD